MSLLTEHKTIFEEIKPCSLVFNVMVKNWNFGVNFFEGDLILIPLKDTLLTKPCRTSLDPMLMIPDGVSVYVTGERIPLGGVDQLLPQLQIPIRTLFSLTL